MKRQIAIFFSASLLISLLGLIYLPQVWDGVVTASPPGTVVTLKAIEPSDCTVSKLERARQVLDHRLAQLELNGRYEIVIQEDEMQLEVSLPPVDNAPQVINVITQVGEVEFVDVGRQVPSPDLVASTETFPTLFSSSDISSIIPPETDTGELFYQIMFQPEASEKLDAFESQSGHYVCLALDNAIASCSTMYHRSGNILEILPSTGDHDISINELALFLTSGPLPVSLEIVE